MVTVLPPGRGWRRGGAPSRYSIVSNILASDKYLFTYVNKAPQKGGGELAAGHLSLGPPFKETLKGSAASNF